MIHKHRVNRRYVRKEAIKRKMRIAGFCLSSNTESKETEPRIKGKYAKGKVHCSCGMCSNKSGRVVVNRHSYPYHGVHNLSRRDKRAIDVENLELMVLKQVS